MSGSGKSTLVNDTLYAAVARHLYRSHDEPEPHESIEGLEHFDKVINVDQSPIGRTPRSNPATYTGLFTDPRADGRGAGMRASAATGRDASASTSQPAGGGRCEACQATAWSRSRCISCPTSTCLRTSARPALQPRDAGGPVQGQEHRADPDMTIEAGPCLLSPPSRRTRSRPDPA